MSLDTAFNTTIETTALIVATVPAPEADDLAVIEFERAPLTDISFGF